MANAEQEIGRGEVEKLLEVNTLNSPARSAPKRC